MLQELAPGRVTFPVSNVVTTTTPLEEVPAFEAIRTFLDRPIESCSQYSGKLVAGGPSHPLIAALHLAFADHRPVCLSPDIVWLVLAQGFAHHINANAEKLRPLLVRHEGKLTLSVQRDDFVKGSPENPWPEVFAAFSEQIREHIGEETHALVVADFSTTGPVERAASEVILLDAVQQFFSYEMVTRCGIPTVVLEGTAADWRNIAARAEQFVRFGLDWWLDALRPILVQFVAAAEGKPDRAFWEGVYKWHGPRSSGDQPFVSGWVRDLFPYVANPAARYTRRGTHAEPVLRRNPWMGVEGRQGPGCSDFPASPGQAPFRWNYLGSIFEMEFVGGLVGVRQEAGTLCLRPEVGWAVRLAGAG